MERDEIEALLVAELADPPKHIAKLMKRQEGLLNFFVGQVLRDMPTADPKVVREMLLRALEGEGGGE